MFQQSGYTAEELEKQLEQAQTMNLSQQLNVMANWIRDLTGLSRSEINTETARRIESGKGQ